MLPSLDQAILPAPLGSQELRGKIRAALHVECATPRKKELSMRYALCLCWILAVNAQAQEPTFEVNKESRKHISQHDATTMSLPARSYKISEVIDATARFLGWNILAEAWEGPEPSVTFKLQNPLLVSKDEAEEVLSELLYNKGFTLIARNPNQKLYEVVYLYGSRGNQALQAGPHRTVAEVMRQPNLKQPVATTIFLPNEGALDYQKAIAELQKFNNREMMTVTRLIWPDKILIRGMQHQVAQIIALLRSKKPTRQQDEGDLESEVLELRRRIEKLRERQPAPKRSRGRS